MRELTYLTFLLILLAGCSKPQKSRTICLGQLFSDMSLGLECGPKEEMLKEMAEAARAGSEESSEL